MDTVVPMCKCNKPAVLRTSKTEKTFGKNFYACENPQATSCGFFEWEEYWKKKFLPSARVQPMAEDTPDVSCPPSPLVGVLNELVAELRSIRMSIDRLGRPCEPNKRPRPTGVGENERGAEELVGTDIGARYIH